MFIFGAFYYLSMYKQNNNKFLLKKAIVLVFTVPVRGFDDLAGQNGSWCSTLAGLARNLACSFKCVFSSSTLIKKKIIANENICNWYKYKTYCMKQSPVIIEIKSRYLNSLWQEHSKADPAPGYLYTYIVSLESSIKGQRGKVMKKCYISINIIYN